MKMTAVAVVFVILALAAVAFAWQKHRALETAQLELADTTARLQKAEAKIKPLEASVEALRKESATQQQALEQARAELASAKTFLEAEKDSGARLREDLARTKEQLAALVAAASRPRSPQTMPSSSIPTLVRPVPMRIAPAVSGKAVGVGVPAR